MSKHTPGPWLAFRGSAFWEVIPQRKGGERKPPYQIADTCSSDPGNPDKGLQEANARLISAAPELLEALEKVVSFVDAGEGTWTVEEQNKARAAIKKAKGECVTEKEHRQRTTGKDAVVREWVGLTDEEIEAAGHLNVEGERMLPYSFARAIEAKLREKNA